MGVRACLRFAQLTGFGNVAPLLNYVSQQERPVPAIEACLPLKELIVSACMKEAWRKLLGHKEMWSLPVSSADVRRQSLNFATSEAFANLDANGDGHIDSAELMAALRKSSSLVCDGGSSALPALMANMIRALDVSPNGMVSLEEFRQLAHW